MQLGISDTIGFVGQRGFSGGIPLNILFFNLTPLRKWGNRSLIKEEVM